MGSGALEEAPLRAHYERKLVVSVRLDLANPSDEVNYSVPTQIARQFAADETIKKVFMVVTRMIIHPKRISSAMERYCSSLLFAFGCSPRNGPLEFPSSVHMDFTDSLRGQSKISHRPPRKQGLWLICPRSTFNIELR